MPVKVGNSYVSEAAYSYAAARANDETEKSGVMKSLAEKFPNLKFSMGTTPFSGTGTNNVSISPKILKQMEKDPEKRMEYEALIYDIAQTEVGTYPAGRKLKSHGFIIGDDGGLRSWSISTSDDGTHRSQSSVRRSNKKNWWQQLLDAPKKKKTSSWKVFQEKLSENFTDIKKGMANISDRYLRECLTDEEKRQKLFDNLRTADEMLASKQGQTGFRNMNVRIDENGEMTVESSKGTVTINESKSRRQIAAAATKSDMQAVLAHLQQDLQEVEEGLKQNMCDEAEVEKAKKLIEQAKQQMAKLPDRAPTPEEQTILSINMLI